MAARLVEILVPAARVDGLRSVLEDAELQLLTEEVLSDELCRLRLLVEADRSGPLVDLVQERLAGEPSFRLLMLPVEAALPRPDPPADAAAKERRTPTFGTRGLSREELYADIDQMSRLTGVFIATVVLSSVVAAVGILRDNVAVVIGAMVIAPLLGPNVALSFGTTLGDASLIRRSLYCNAVGMVLALGLSIGLGLVLPIDPAVKSIEERTAVHLSDIALALASGSAATLAITTGIPTALVGVMVAVALLPPTVVVGLMLGDGRFNLAGGAALLLLVNVICVNLAGVITFLVQGVRPLRWWEAERAKRAARLALGIWLTLLVALAAVILLAGQ